MTSTALITTTINVPHALWDYARDAKAHKRDVKIIVSGDRKTPAAAAELCAQVARETGVECEYMSPAAQSAFMRPYPALDAHLPWDCVQRRDVALLRAVADGADVVITIDDDNFLACEDYFGKHALTGTTARLDAYGNAGEWFNVCDFIADENGRRFFPRGYGIAARRAVAPAAAGTAGRQRECGVAVNAGLWLGDPDIDAATRISVPINATRYTRDGNFFVDVGAWTPFNSQNTALARRVLPAYFLSPFVGRYEDIFISYFVKRIADHFGDGVAFGDPLVRQDRNDHNLLHDLRDEFLGTKISDDLVAALEQCSLSGADYGECLLQLSQHCEHALREVDGMSRLERAQMSAFFAGCRLWATLPLWHGGRSA